MKQKIVLLDIIKLVLLTMKEKWYWLVIKKVNINVYKKIIHSNAILIYLSNL